MFDDYVDLRKGSRIRAAAALGCGALAGVLAGALVAGLRLPGTSSAHDWCWLFAIAAAGGTSFTVVRAVLARRAKHAWFVERGLVHGPPPRATARWRR